MCKCEFPKWSEPAARELSGHRYSNPAFTRELWNPKGSAETAMFCIAWLSGEYGMEPSPSPYLAVGRPEHECSRNEKGRNQTHRTKASAQTEEQISQEERAAQSRQSGSRSRNTRFQIHWETEGAAVTPAHHLCTCSTGDTSCFHIVRSANVAKRVNACKTMAFTYAASKYHKTPYLPGGQPRELFAFSTSIIKI